MKRLYFGSLVAGLAVMALPLAASAQFDHYSCFKAKDSAKFSATATLNAATDAFDAGACTVKGKAKLYCVPTAKEGVVITVDKQEVAPFPVATIEPLPDIVCYNVKCPKATIADLGVTDQFASRNLSKFKAKMLCAPAEQGLVTTTLGPTTTTLGATTTTMP